MITFIMNLLTNILDIVVRLPPLFLMDIILKSPYAFSIDFERIFMHISSLKIFNMMNASANVEIPWTHIFFGIICFFGFISAGYTFFLSTRHLLSAYLLVASIIVIFWSYIMNVEYIKYCISLNSSGSCLQTELFSINRGTIKFFFANYFAQIFWAIIFCFSSISLPTFPPKRLLAGLAFIFPILISIIPLPDYILVNVPVMVAAVEIFFLLKYLLNYQRVILDAILPPIYRIMAVRSFHVQYNIVLQLLSEHKCHTVFKTFWYLRALNQAIIVLHDVAFSEYRKTGIFTVPKDGAFLVGQTVLLHTCDTIVAVIGFSFVLRSLVFCLLFYVQILLSIPLESRNTSKSLVVPLIFITLAMQYGLTTLEPEERLVKLYCNFLIIFTSVLFDIHYYLDIAINGLLSSVNALFYKYLRVILGGVVLISSAWYLLIFLLTKHNFNTWLCAVSTFVIQLMIKVVLSLISYVLEFIDGRSNKMCENLYRCKYYLTVVGNVIDFIMNVLFFLNACYAFIPEGFSLTRVVLTLFHFHYNVKKQIETGVRVFSLRYTAIRLVATLRRASQEQIRNFDDICSVCHQELTSARITSCNHYFHSFCLENWLYDHNMCPFCHVRIIMRP